MNVPREPGDADAAADSELVPSVKEILDGVAADAGLLPGSLDAAFTPDEDEAARDVAKAMSAVRPLLERYRHRYEELTSLLSKAQASASSATVVARELCRGHLQTFGRLEDDCTTLAQEMERAAAAASAAADNNNPGQQGVGGDGNEAAARQRRVAAAAATAEADALAARHHSLVQRRRRMRSALRVLEVSESGRAALETGAKGAAQAGGRGARAEEAMEAIKSLRGLLGEYRAVSGDALERTGSRSPAATTAAAPHQEALVAAAADGELARVAHGRLQWLTRSLRAHLSSELASALRQVDPLAAGSGAAQGGGGGRGGGGGEMVLGRDKEGRREGLARVKEAMTRLVVLQFGGRPPSALGRGVGADADATKMSAGAAGVGSGGTIWALDGLLEPVAVRFRFHFEEDRPTNRVDRPEWFLSFLLRALEAYRPLLLLFSADVQHPPTASPACGEGGGEARTEAGEGGGWGAGGVDPVAYFARGLTLLARRRLRSQLGAAASDGSLLSHTVEEALVFDRRLDEEAGYAECPARFPQQTWPRCVEVFAQDEERFELWMNSDADAAEAKLTEAARAPGAWRAVDWKNGPASSTPVTPSAVALCRIFLGVAERYRPLRDPLKQLRFARHVQEPVLHSYRNMLYRRGNECRLNSVFRDDGGGGDETAGAGAGAGAAGGGVTSAADGLTATWAAALGAAMLGPAQDADDDKSPIGRWRGYCLAVASCAYVCSFLRESEDDMLFAEMGEAAAVAAALLREGGEMASGQAGRPSSLGAVGNVVGVAVGGVSQAVTSVATTAETATAGVVRAVGAQGTIIGPTHAISAALTSLKGAARRVRRVSSGHRGTGDTDNGTEGGRGGLKGAMAGEDAIDEGRGEEQEEEEEGKGDGGGDGGTTAGEAGAAASGEGGRSPGEAAGGGYGGDSAPAAEAATRDSGTPATAAGEWTGSVFGEEAGRYGDMLEAMVRGAVESCRDGFLWRTRSYLRAWDRGIAVVVPASVSAAQSSLSGPRPAAAAVAEASGRLGPGVELLETAVGVARECLPPAQFHNFWTALASELDVTLVKQIVARRSKMSQDEGLQLWADLRVLMGPFDVLARRRPERHFPALAEASVLLSLEKSQLRSLSSGLDAHGGGVEEAVRGRGWDGWREEGGALSPEGTQMRDMLENAGVRRLGPAEASLLLDKRLKGDRLAVLGSLSAAADAASDGGRGVIVQGAGGGGGAFVAGGVSTRGGGEAVVGGAAGGSRETAISSFG